MQFAKRGSAGLLWMLVFTASLRAQIPGLIHADGFEAHSPDCIAGTLAGDSLPAPSLAGAEPLGCFEVRNDGVIRLTEAASGSLPLARSLLVRDTDLDRIVVVGPGGRRWPAELRVLSRWGRPLADTGAPVRWLHVALSVTVEARSTARLALLRLPSQASTADSGQLLVTGTGQIRTIDTGLASFTVDLSRSQPIRLIAVREAAGAEAIPIFTADSGSPDEGWRVRAAPPGHFWPFAAGEAIPGSVVVQNWRWETTGPTAAITHTSGWFEFPGNAQESFCEGVPGRPRLPFSMSLHFRRGSRDIDFEWQVGNACGNPQAAPDDGLLNLYELAFSLPLGRQHPETVVPLAGYLGAPVEEGAASAGEFLAIRQHRGGGVPWTRSASLSRNGLPLHAAEFHESPALGLHRVASASGELRLVALAQMPWLRFREPQGLATQGGRLDFELVAERIPVGKAKGLWFAGRLGLDVAPAAEVIASAERMRGQGLAALERALVLRPLPESLDAAGVLPPVGGALDHAPGHAYLSFLDRKHADTVGDEACVDAATDQGSQWTCAKTFGLQLWPDVQFEGRFGFVENRSPGENDVKLNYWDPAHIELVEFLRSGDPRWLWEFALPQARLMAYTVYYNFGQHPGGSMDGHVFGNGGVGDGLWHRNGLGSADWTYNRHQALAYLIRPSADQRDRFRAAGQAAALRFSNDPGDDLTWPAIGRGNLQFIESLANCAQFVPGAEGSLCDQRLREVLTWLIENSMSAGLMCERKRLAGPDCFLGQYFMLYAWYYPILDRLYLNYGHTYPPAIAQAWRRALVETPERVLESLPRTAGGAVDVNAIWPNALLCTLGGASFDQVQSCSAVYGENLSENKPATLSLLARARDYGANLCPSLVETTQTLFAGQDPLGFLRIVARGGWFKGAAEASQELATAALGYGRCPP